MAKFRIIPLIVVLMVILTGCATQAEQPDATQTPGTLAQAKPKIPDKLKLDENGEPELKVYVVEDKEVKTMNIEDYVARVLAGEMKNDWPMEALKAQAVLARIFVLKFAAEKTSRYENADISTDIEEAQAYSEADVNDRILTAIKETRGQVLSSGGELVNAWFHAHSGGVTALAKEGLNYEKEEPNYTMIAKGYESDKAPLDAQEWEATFTMQEFTAALKKIGAQVSDVTTISIGERGESGRAITILVNDTSVNAPELRLALGSTEMRSTLITSLKISDGSVYIAGKGYGHGVGMPQWGAYGLAEEGKKYEEIVLTYFKDVEIVSLW